MLKYLVKDNAFLIDGLGAALTAVMLIMVVAPFESFFGLPEDVVIRLSMLPILYSIYSFVCHMTKPKLPLFLRVIAIANLIYCLITFGLIIHYFSSVSIFGILYFFIEKAIVIPLALWEWKVAIK